MKHFLFFLFLAAGGLRAETPFWGILYLNNPVTKRTGFWFDGHYRTIGIGLVGQQILLRPGYWVTLRPGVVLNGGYVHAFTSTRSDAPIPFVRHEHRAWEQLILTNRAGRTNFQNRFTLEQRYFGQYVARNGEMVNTGWKPEDRVRYRLRVAHPVAERLQLVFFDEIFINFGRNVAARHYDQNRVYAALSVNLNQTNRMEFAYMWTRVQNRIPARMVDQHGILISFFNNSSLRK